MIGFSIYSKTHLNNFVNSGLLRELSKHFELEVIDSGLIESRSIINEAKYKNGPKLPKILISVSNFIQLVNLWKHREVSMAHYVRAISTFGNKTERQKWKCVVFSNMEISLIRRFLVRGFSSGVANRLVIIIESLLRKVFVLRAYRDSLKDVKVLVIPFSGHLAHEFGTQIWAARRLKIPTIALQENWDNLSSKTIVSEEPDYFLVWGEQSASHVRSVHKLTQCEIIVNGSPRFDAYFKSDPHKPVVISPNGEKTQVTSPFILVAGTGDGLDDLALLKTVHLAMTALNRFSIVVYRPHPLTRSIPDFDQLANAFPELLIDSHPDARKFNHHVGLIQNCELLVNHFSTLTLEALIAKKRVCVPLFLGRQDSTYGYDRILSEWLHLIGINQMDGIEFPRNQKDLESSIHRLMDSNEDNGNSTDWYCKPGGYAEGLIQVLDVALNLSQK
jgi:hypothetical protein